MSESMQQIHKLKVLDFDEASTSKNFETRHSKWKDRFTKQKYENTKMDALSLFNETKYKSTEAKKEEDKIKKRFDNKKLQPTSYLNIEDECKKPKKYNEHGEVVEVLFSRDSVVKNISGLQKNFGNIKTCIYQQQSSKTSKLNGDRKKRSRNTLIKQMCACTAMTAHHTASATQMKTTKSHHDHPRKQFKLLTFSKHSSSSTVGRRKSPSLTDVYVCVSSTIRSITNSDTHAALGPESMSCVCIGKSLASLNRVRPQQQNCEPCLNKCIVKHPKGLKSPAALCPQCRAKKHIKYSVVQSTQTQKYTKQSITQGTETQKHTQNSVTQDKETKNQSKPSPCYLLNPTEERRNDFTEHDKMPCENCFKPRILRNLAEPANLRCLCSKDPKGFKGKLKCFLCIKRKSKNKKPSNHIHEETSTANLMGMKPQLLNCQPCLKKTKQETKLKTPSKPCTTHFHEETSTAEPIGVRPKLLNCKPCLKNTNQETKLKTPSNAPCAKHLHEGTSTADPIGVRPQLLNCEPCLKNTKQETKLKTPSNAPCANHLHEAKSTATPITVKPQHPNCEPCLKKSTVKSQKLLISPEACCPYCSRVRRKKTNNASDVNRIKPSDQILNKSKEPIKESVMASSKKHAKPTFLEPCNECFKEGPKIPSLRKPISLKCQTSCDIIIDASCGSEDKPKASCIEFDKISHEKCIKTPVLSDLDAISGPAAKFTRKPKDCTLHHRSPNPQKSQDKACGISETKNTDTCTYHDNISYEKKSSNFDSCTCPANFKRTTKGTDAPCTVHLNKPTSCHAMLNASCEAAERKNKATCTKSNNKICYEKCFKPCVHNILAAGFKRKPKNFAVKPNNDQNFKTSQTSCNIKLDASCEAIEDKTEATYTDCVYPSTVTAFTYTKPAAADFPIPYHENEHLFSARTCLKYFLFGIIILIWSPFIIMVLLCWLLTYPLRPTCVANKKSTYRERLEDNYRSAEHKQQRPFAKTFCKWVKDAKGQCYVMNSIISLMQETPSKRIVRKLPDPNLNTAYEIQRMECRKWTINPNNTEWQITAEKNQTGIVVANQPAPRCAHRKSSTGDKEKLSPCSGQDFFSVNVDEQSTCCMCGDKRSKSYPHSEIKDKPTDRKRKCCVCSDSRSVSFQHDIKKETSSTRGDVKINCECRKNRIKFPTHDSKKETYSCDDNKSKCCVCSDNRNKSLPHDNKNRTSSPCDDKKNECGLCSNKTSKDFPCDEKMDKPFCGNKKSKSSLPDRKICECSQYGSNFHLCDDKKETSSPCLSNKSNKYCVCKNMSKYSRGNKKEISSCNNKKIKCCICSDNSGNSPVRHSHDSSRESYPCGDKKSKIRVCDEINTKSPQCDDKKEISSCSDKKGECICGENRSKCPARDNEVATSPCGDKKMKSCVYGKHRSSPPRDDKKRAYSPCGDKKIKCCMCGKTKSKCCPCGHHRCRSPSPDDRKGKYFEKRNKYCTCGKRKYSPCDIKNCSKCCPCGDHTRKSSPCGKRKSSPCNNKNWKCYPCGDHKRKSSPCGNKSCKPVKRKNKSTCIRNESKTGVCCKVQPTRCQKSTPIVNCFTLLRNTVRDVEAQMIEVPPDCEDLYLQTLKRKPCFCLYKCCPSLYPYLMVICDCYRSFIKVFLYVVITCFWFPTLFCFYCCWEILSCCFCL